MKLYDKVAPFNSLQFQMLEFLFSQVSTLNDVSKAVALETLTDRGTGIN